MYLSVLKKGIDPLCRRLLVMLLLASELSACAGRDSLLNSDRIERVFGSYGVAVLHSDSQRRVASLYSGSNPDRITRTYAVVDFATAPGNAFAGEHALILRGESIGATFRKAGWEVSKQHLFIGELEVPPDYAEIGELMQIALPATLATHVYLLTVSKDDNTFNYATIAEIHHPDYLDVIALKSIYGEIIFDDSNRDNLHDFIGPPNPRK